MKGFARLNLYDSPPSESVPGMEGEQSLCCSSFLRIDSPVSSYKSESQSESINPERGYGPQIAGAARATPWISTFCTPSANKQKRI